MVANGIVLFLEILYYTLFMKFAKKEGKLSRYFILFLIINIFFYLVGTNQVYSYLILNFMVLFGLKYIAKVKTSLYDLLFLFVMMLVKIAIEGICCFLFFKLVDRFIFVLIIDIIKLLFVILLRNKINIAYNYLRLKWNNNNFYIRYIFSILFFAYILLSFFFLMNR